MKKKYFSFLFALAVMLLPSNAWATAYVVWCEANSTLYFTERSERLDVGGTFVPEDGSGVQTITKIWRGANVTNTPCTPAEWAEWWYGGWWGNRAAATTAVIESSFSNVLPHSTASWFENCSNLTTIIGLQYLNTSDVVSMEAMFIGCSSLTSLDLSGWNMEKVGYMPAMFKGCSSLTSLNLSGWNLENITNEYGDPSVYSIFDSMFDGCSSLTSIDASEWKFGTKIVPIFQGCSSLTNLNLRGWNLENVTDLSDLFSGCSNLTSLDLSEWNTENVTNMDGMFYGCSGFTSLDLSGWNTENVTTMVNMFRSCSSLTSLDLSGWNTRNVTNMTWMFYSSSSLRTIYVSEDWSTENLYYRWDDRGDEKMFYNCTSLVGGDGTVFDYRYTDKRRAYAGEGGYLTFKAYDLTVGESGVATLYIDFPVTVPNDENITGVYYGTSIEDETLQLGEVENVVPAKTAVIVYAAPGVYSFRYSNEKGEAVADNVLQGSLVEQNVSDIDGKVLTLGHGDTNGEVGFYLYTGETLAANKAYIVLDVSSEVKSVAIAMDEATAISRTETAEQGEQVYYNLKGQRVASPRRGIYVVNGKKVFIR